MENASNALIMAGGVLIGVLIISLAVYLFVDFGSTSADINKQVEEQHLVQFNSKFLVYEDVNGDKGLTIYDAITVGGFAQQNNEYYGDDDTNNDFRDNYKVEVILKSSKGTTYNFQRKTINQYNGMIQDEMINVTKLPTYKCTVSINPNNGRVKTVTFTKK